MMRITTKVGALLLACAMQAGCGNPTDVTVYEPGVYKGEPDPLLKKLEDPKLQQELRDRVTQIQTDR
jgi:hypothetical protein